MHQGRKYLVVPVVMMVPGVHTGSRGPLLHTAAELSKNPQGWNNIPIMISHPQVNGVDVSATVPEVLVNSVGIVQNTQIVNGSLKAEAWLDELKLQNISTKTLAIVKAGQPLEVSTGCFTGEIKTGGIYNNKRYKAIAVNLRPDHLALLPDEIGACSWNAGCGVRNSLKTNKTDDNEMNEEEILLQKQEAYDSLAQQALLDNQQGYITMLEQVRSKLDSMDNAMSYHMLEEMYDDFLIIRVRNKTGDNSIGYFRQSYQLDSEGNVEFQGNPIKVTRNVSYTQVNNTSGVRRTIFNNSKTKDMANETKKPCCLEKVVALINNKATKFTGEDEAWLMTLSAEQLDKLQPEDTAPAVVPPAAPAQAPIVPSVTAPVVNAQTKKYNTPEEFLETVPAELRDQFRSGLVLHKEHRSELVQAILTNSQPGVWTEAELQLQDTDMLEKLSKQFKPQENYVGQGAGRILQVNSDKKVRPLLPVGVTATSAK